MQRYIAARDSFLDQAIQQLANDERICAAWLAGSFGRDEQDEFSDLDLWVVVSAETAETLCKTDRRTGAGTTEARHTLISTFGDPAIVHENHGNAPSGGSFTTVVYKESALMVDWTLVPEQIASRPAKSLLLFESVGIPHDDLPDQPAAANFAHHLNERYAFAWMLTVPAAKAWRRADGVRFHAILELIYGAAAEVEGLLNGQSPGYSHRSRAPFCSTSNSQRRALIEISDRLLELSSNILSAGVGVSPHASADALSVWLGR